MHGIRSIGLVRCCAALALLLRASCAFAQSAPAKADDAFRIGSCQHPVSIVVRGIPPHGKERFQGSNSLCDDGQPSTWHLAGDADLAREATLTATLHAHGLDARVDLSNGTTYEAINVPLDTDAFELTSGSAPALTLSVHALTDDDYVSMQVVDATSSRTLRELIRIKHLKVKHAQGIGDIRVTFRFACVPVHNVVELLAEVSDMHAQRTAGGGFLIGKEKDAAQIAALRGDVEKLPEDAQPAALRALLQRIVALGQNAAADEIPAYVGDEYATLGALASADKDYAGAEQFYRKQLAQLELHLGTQDAAAYALALGNVADARVDQKDFDGARKLYEQALALMEKHPDNDTHPAAAEILASLSSLAWRQKHYDEAGALITRAYVRISDPDHVDWSESHVQNAQQLVATMEGYVGLLLGIDDSGAAQPHLQHALELTQARFGDDSKETEGPRTQVILNAQVREDTAREKRYLIDQLAGAIVRHEQTSDTYVRSLVRLADLNAYDGDLEHVIAQWLLIVELRRATLGDDSAALVAGQRDLAVMYRLQGHVAKADAAERSAAAVKAVEVDAAQLAKLSVPKREAMRNGDALKLLCAHFELTKVTPDMPASAHARLLEQQGECLASGAPHVAIARYAQALSLRMAQADADRAQVRHSAARLVELCEQAGDTQGAERYRALVKE